MPRKLAQNQHVESQHLCHALLIFLGKSSGHANPGIVDQYVDMQASLFNMSEQLCSSTIVREIHGNGQDIDARAFPDPAGGGFQLNGKRKAGPITQPTDKSEDKGANCSTSDGLVSQAEIGKKGTFGIGVDTRG